MVLKEDCPLRVSEETANRPQLKACGKPAESRVDSEANGNMRPRQDVQIHIPNWKCPPNVAMDCSWHVAAAEESQEVKVQNIREARVLEACYHVPPPFPLSKSLHPFFPSVAPDASSGHLDDSQVPAIPFRGIEEEEEEMYMEPENLNTPLSDASVPLELPTISKPDIAEPGIGLDADAAAAATAAYRATLKWKQQGSLIDPDLLISILSNPDMIRKFVDERGFSADSLNGRKIGEPSSSGSGSGFGPLAGPKMVTGVSTNEAKLKFKELGSLIDPDLLINILSNPEMIRKLVNERGLSADSLNGRKIDQPSSSGSGPLTGPKMVTRGSTDKPSLPGTIGVAPFSWTPSEPFRRSGVDEVTINNLINQLRTSRETPCSAPSVAITPGTGPAPRPDIPRAILNCVAPHSAPHSVCPIPPSVATAPGIGPFPRPDFPRASFQCVRPPYVPAIPRSLPCVPPHSAPPHTVFPIAPSVARTTGTGTPLKPDILIPNLPVVSLTVPQNAPSMATKDMEYLKSLIRKHGSGQETARIDRVEVGKPHNHQQGPSTLIQPQPESARPHCKFFNTPRGCRNGVNCRFLHVLENHPNAVRLLQDAPPDAKKMKLTGEFGINK